MKQGYFQTKFSSQTAFLKQLYLGMSGTMIWDIVNWTQENDKGKFQNTAVQ